MRCPVCKFDNESTVRFCGGCGYRLSNTCPSCGEKNSLTRRFCGACGADLKEADYQFQEMEQQAQENARAHWVEKELDFLKDQWAEGYIIYTCPSCQTKNRLPKARRFDTARCGSCKETFQAVSDS